MTKADKTYPDTHIPEHSQKITSQDIVHYLTSTIDLDTIDGAQHVSIHGANFLIDEDTTIFSVSRRQSRRVQSSIDDKLILEDGQEIQLLDISAEGIRLEESIPPNSELRGTLKVADSSHPACIYNPSASHSVSARIRVLDKPAWTKTIVESRMGPWRPRGQVSPADVHQMLDESGYLGLRASNELDADWLKGFSPSVGIDVLWMDKSEKPVAHVSVSRAYSRTWITHQFACLRDHPDRYDAKHDLYRLLSSIPTMIEGNDAILFAYLNRQKTWHRMVTYSFVRWMNNPNHAILSAWDRWEPTNAAGSAKATSTANIEPLDAEGEEWLVNHTQNMLPQLVCNGLDIELGKISKSFIHEAFEENNLKRERKGWMIRSGEQTVAVALIEHSSECLSIFNLFNIAHLFFDHSASPEHRESLLRYVYSWYNTRGISNPLILALPGTLSGSEGYGFELAETLGLMCWSATGLRQYENFIEFTLGRYQAEKRRKNGSV